MLRRARALYLLRSNRIKPDHHNITFPSPIPTPFSQRLTQQSLSLSLLSGHKLQERRIEQC